MRATRARAFAAPVEAGAAGPAPGPGAEPRRHVIMHPLVRSVGRAIARDRLIAPGDRVAIAVSGGADSVALALILHAISLRRSWRLAGLIHVNHHIRPEAGDDAAFVVELGRQLSLPVVVEDADVPSRARDSRRSIETVAREARYECLDRAAARLDASLVATGHTLDDQAETVMLRWLRGASLRGAGAIRPKRGRYVRPLLGCRRADLRAFLEHGGHTYREDATNADVSVPRNRLRHELMPILERIAPRGPRALARFAAQAREDEALLSELAREASAGRVRSGSDGVQIPRDWLKTLPAAIARRVVRDAIELAGGSAANDDVAAILALAGGRKPSARLDLHRVRVWCDPASLAIGTVEPRRGAVPFHLPLDLPGEVHVDATGAVVSASFLSGTRLPPSSARDPSRAILQAASVQAPFVVRSRRPGDRLQPLGAPGSRKVQDLLVDRKMPRHERDQVPVVVDAAGRIVWVAGVAMAHACRVTAPEAGMVILELKKGHQ